MVFIWNPCVQKKPVPPFFSPKTKDYSPFFLLYIVYNGLKRYVERTISLRPLIAVIQSNIEYLTTIVTGTDLYRNIFLNAVEY